jgi:8-oxo-dGTP diphosphatase
LGISRRPGGGGRSLIDALKREIDEETGIQVEAGKLVGVYSNLKAHIVVCDFLCAPISGEPRISPESLEVEWAAILPR